MHAPNNVSSDTDSIDTKDALIFMTFLGIEKHGQHIITTNIRLSDNDNLAYLYTIGNHFIGLSDMMIVGGSGPLLATILNQLRDYQLARMTPFTDGETLTGHDIPVLRHQLRFATLDTCGKRLMTKFAAHTYHHWDYLMTQVIIFDDQGRFPDDNDCHPHYINQLSWKRLLA